MALEKSDRGKKGGKSWKATKDVASYLGNAGWWATQASFNFTKALLATIPQHVNASRDVLVALYSVAKDWAKGVQIADGTLWIVLPSERWMKNPKFEYALQTREGGPKNVRVQSDESYDKTVAIHPAVNLKLIFGLNQGLPHANGPISYMPEDIQVLFLTPFKRDHICTGLNFSAAPNFTELNLQSLVELCEKDAESLNALLLPKKTIAEAKVRSLAGENFNKKSPTVFERRRKYSIFHTVGYSSANAREGAENPTDFANQSAKLRFLGYTSSFYLSGNNLREHKPGDATAEYYDVGVYHARYPTPDLGGDSNGGRLYNHNYGKNETVKANPQIYESWNGVISTTTVLEKAGNGEPYRFTPQEIVSMATGSPEGAMVLQRKYPFSSGKYKTWQSCFSFPNNNVTADLFKTPLLYQNYDFGEDGYYTCFPSKSKILIQKLKSNGNGFYVSDVYLFVRPSLHGVVTKFKTNKLRAVLSPSYFEHFNFGESATDDPETPIGSNFSLAMHKMFCHPEPIRCPAPIASPCSATVPNCSLVPACPPTASAAFSKLSCYMPESFHKLFCSEIREQAKLECCDGHPANPIGKKHGYFFAPDGKENLRLQVAAEERANSTCESFMLGATPQSLSDRLEMFYKPSVFVSPKFFKKGKRLLRRVAKAPTVARKVVRKLKAGEPVRLGKTGYVVAVKKVPLPPPKNLPPEALESHEKREETKRILRQAKLEDHAAKEAHNKALEEARRKKKVEKLEAKLEKSRAKIPPELSPPATEGRTLAENARKGPVALAPEGNEGKVEEEPKPVAGKASHSQCVTSGCKKLAAIGCAQCKKKHYCSDKHLMKTYCKGGKICPKDPTGEGEREKLAAPKSGKGETIGGKSESIARSPGITDVEKARIVHECFCKLNYANEITLLGTFHEQPTPMKKMAKSWGDRFMVWSSGEAMMRSAKGRSIVDSAYRLANMSYSRGLGGKSVLETKELNYNLYYDARFRAEFYGDTEKFQSLREFCITLVTNYASEQLGVGSELISKDDANFIRHYLSARLVEALYKLRTRHLARELELEASELYEIETPGGGCDAKTFFGEIGTALLERAEEMCEVGMATPTDYIPFPLQKERLLSDMKDNKENWREGARSYIIELESWCIGDIQKFWNETKEQYYFAPEDSDPPKLVGCSQSAASCAIANCPLPPKVKCGTCSGVHYCTEKHMLKGYCKTLRFCPLVPITDQSRPSEYANFPDDEELARVGPGFGKTMSEFYHHDLHSGSKTGPPVTSKAQALAIAYSEQRRNASRGGSGKGGSVGRRK